MAVKENWDYASTPYVPQAHGKCLSLKRPGKTNPVDANKTKKFDERFSCGITVDSLITFQRENLLPML